MSALWFIGFSLVWTAILALGAQTLSRDPVPARFAHNIWRGAAVLSILPWILVGLVTVLPTLWATPIPDLPYVESAASALNDNAAVQAVVESDAAPLLGWALAAILLTGWLVRMGQNVVCQMRLQRIKANARPETDLNAELWAAQLGLNSAPTIARIDTGSPFLAGISQRTIYLPQAISTQADADIILAHECTHIARGDLTTRPFERLVADIFWFSPFAWQMRRQMDYWREAACDAQTAALTGDSVAYARALAHTARLVRPEPKLPLPVAAFILPERSTLKRRLTQLLERDARRPRRRMAFMAGAVACLIAPLALAQTATLSSASQYVHPVLKKGKITSAFGKRIDPFKNKEVWHGGIDIGYKMDAPIYAPADAKVLYSGKKDGYGYTVDILVKDGTKIRFAQMNKIMVKKGTHIQAGEMIGKMGMTGRATGPHLHLEVWRDGEQVDPSKVRGLELYPDCC